MKTIYYIFILIVFSDKADAHKIILVADIWCPYNCSSQQKPGVIIEVAKEIFEAKGYEVVWRPMPYSRALKEVRKGGALEFLGPTKVMLLILSFRQKK